MVEVFNPSLIVEKALYEGITNLNRNEEIVLQYDKKMLFMKA